MIVFTIMNVSGTQHRMCYDDYSTNVFNIVTTLMMQHHRRCANILMIVFPIMNVSGTQHCVFYDDFLMFVFSNRNALMVQRRRCCAFDSPGLASESEGYPGSFAVSSNNAVGVVPFIPRYFITAFHAEKAQHLRR